MTMAGIPKYAFGFVFYLWGIETWPEQSHLVQFCRLYFTYEELKHSWYVTFDNFTIPFVFYLWGIETLYNPHYMGKSFLFVFYLWGIETKTSDIIDITEKAFVFYLWGIETRAYERAH